MRILHVSDTHFHSNDADNKDVLERLKLLYDQYFAPEPSTWLMVTGDITDDGAPQQYENAYRALEPFKGRLLLAPGNHDAGFAGNFYSPIREKHYDELLALPLGQPGPSFRKPEPLLTTIKDGDLKVMAIGLNTVLETLELYDFACGEVGTRQLEQLRALLLAPASQGYVKIVFFHHHALWVGNPFLELKDARDFWKTVYGRVSVVAFGHKHEARTWQSTLGTSWILAATNLPAATVVQMIEIAPDGAVQSRPVPVVPGLLPEERPEHGLHS
ncbi:MAG TPA: metallophosphoesterase [Myxococcaceae bacterium]|jgi:3',5'-cyclic AMP phosphodiesterase CpdA